MNTPAFFTKLLNVELPFKIESVDYKDDESATLSKKSVHIHVSVDTNPMYRPSDSVIKDYEKRTWRHLNLFQYPCYIHCNVPKYKDKTTGKVKTLEVPWSKQKSGFTLMFEEFALELVKIYGCVSEVSRQLDIYPQRLWKIIEDFSEKKTLEELDMSRVERIGIDETSRKKGHDYITCFIDLDTGQLLHVVEGKSSETIVAFEEYATSKGLNKEKVSDVSIDMSPAFISGVEKLFPNSAITIDKFHVSQLVQRAFDSIRKSIGKKEERKKINKWLFFKKYDQLTEDDQEKVDQYLLKYPLLESIYELKNNFKELWEQTNKLEASSFLSYWTDMVSSFNKKVLNKLANTLNKHHQKIINVVESKVTNAALEGFNSKIQTLKRKARGYKDVEKLMMIVRLHCAAKPT